MAATSSTSSVGYLDTPAKYRDMAPQPDLDSSHNRDDDLDREIEDTAAGKHCLLALDGCAL